MNNECKRAVKSMPNRILEMICNVMVDELGMDAEVKITSGHPTIISEVGTIIYFNSSNSFRIFLKFPGELGASHVTVKGSPDDLIKKVLELRR